MTTWQFALAVAGFFVHIGVLIATVSYKLAKAETAILEQLKAERKEIDENRERDGRIIGEALAALRTKVHEIETWARDTFVRKDSLDKTMERMEKIMGDMKADLSHQIGRLSDRLDSRAEQHR